MKIALIIPAKEISKRVNNKNLYKLDGESLIRHACRKALSCRNVNYVYLDTESDRIIADVEDLFNCGLRLIRRPRSLADNALGANEMMVWALHSIEEVDVICQTFATSPLISAETIDQCIERFLDSSIHDSFFTVQKVQEYYWDANNNPINFDINRLPNSFDLESCFVETHGLYGIRSESCIKHKRRVGETPMLIEINKLEALDINQAEDLTLLEALYSVS